MAHIVVIDDDVELTENLSTVLRSEGYEVSTRDQTEGAVEELEKNTPDLLILDVMFPENPAAGFDLARKIRKTKKLEKLPIVLLTSINQQFPMDFSSRDIDKDWMPVQDFVEKPVDIDELIKKVRTLLESSRG
jgi:DNA-binding response OmpR family regulator